MVDLNELQYETNYEELRDLIFSKYSDEEIFRYYVGDFKIGKTFISPFRSERIPSFAIFIGKNHGDLMYNEMLLKDKGDCFRLVERLFNLSAIDALLKICLDLNIQNTGVSDVDRVRIKAIKKNRVVEPLNIGVKYREWNREDKIFWSSFGISKKTLLRYNVRPISHVFFNGFMVKCDPLAYAFKEMKKGNITFKIYQPHSETNKWSNNHGNSVIQGWDQLPETGEILIITSSLKDSMSIIDNNKIPSIAPQGENHTFSKEIIKELKARFKRIYIFYDNDYTKKVNWGQEYAMETCLEHNLLNICIPEKCKTKDYSDMIERHKKQKTVRWLDSVLKNVA